MRPPQVLAVLHAYESPNVTYLDPDGSWPIVWERARGVNVWDAAGKKYLDLTAAFGVAAAGHANPRVVRAGQKQMARLLHAMGDVHPHALKARLARDLSRLTFERWGSKSKVSGKTIFCNSGFEAVEAAFEDSSAGHGQARRDRVFRRLPRLGLWRFERDPPTAFPRAVYQSIARVCPFCSVPRQRSDDGCCRKEDSADSSLQANRRDPC